jgi:ABC-type transport system involved in multi-copper enzyme maturation permease subunit
MKGLIIKDFLVLLKQGKVLAAVLLFYAIYSAVTQSISMIGYMVVTFCLLMPINSISYDEHYKWDKYALSMPISRKNIVYSKYIFSLILILAGMILVAIVSTLIILFSNNIKFADAVEMLGATCAVGMIFIAVAMPVFFKFGAEKGRFLIMPVIFIPTILVLLFPRLGVASPSEQIIQLLVWSSPLIITIVWLVSIKISITIYNNKEF